MKRILDAGLILALLLTFLPACAQEAAPPAPPPAAAAADPATDPAAAATPETSSASVDFANDDEKISYLMGADMGARFGKYGFTISPEKFMKGFEDGKAGNPPAFSNEEQQKLGMDFKARIGTKQKEEQKKLADENIVKANEFLEKNKAAEGVVTLPSGLQYKVLTDGTGEIPKTTDKVEVNYRGTLVDGTEFDSSYKRNKPFATAVNKDVIKGWQEALQLMKVGSKWQLFVPPALAYGERGNRGIPPNSALIFEIEMLRIVPVVAAFA